MARAPLPSSIPISTFFVLQWEPNAEEFVIHLDDDKRSSHRLGSYSPQVVRQLTWWGLEKMLAARVVDAAREFRAVQVIPAQSRVINLIPRTKSQDVVAEALRQIENQPQNQFIQL
jgi:hypothetical protein